MVEILYNTERKKEAIDAMEKIVKLRPTNTNYMMTLADLYEEIDDPDSSKKYFFKILELEPSNDKAKRKIKNYAK
jgi:tetratricopeptide (TPR) repeat protein